MVRALAFHQCVPGSIPGPGVIRGLSLLVLYSAPRGFSPGTPVLPSPQKPTFDLIWFDLFDLQSPQLVQHSCSAWMIWDSNKVVIIIVIIIIIIIICVCKKFFRPCQEPVCRLNVNGPLTIYCTCLYLVLYIKKQSIKYIAWKCKGLITWKLNEECQLNYL